MSAGRPALGARGAAGRGNDDRGGKVVLTALIGWIIIGIIAGWLAGLVVGGSGFGVLGDIGGC